MANCIRELCDLIDKKANKLLCYIIVDYCLNHMNDKGAKESFQVCYDTDMRDGMIKYLYDNNLVVDGKKPVDVSVEIGSRCIYIYPY